MCWCANCIFLYSSHTLLCFNDYKLSCRKKTKPSERIWLFVFYKGPSKGFSPYQLLMPNMGCAMTSYQHYWMKWTFFSSRHLRWCLFLILCYSRTYWWRVTHCVPYRDGSQWQQQLDTYMTMIISTLSVFLAILQIHNKIIWYQISYCELEKIVK